MTWGLVAIAGATLVGGVVASSTGSSAAKQAAATQTQAADESAAVSREGLAQQESQYEQTRQDTLAQAAQSRSDTLGIYNTSRNDLAPYRSVGQNALLALSDQLGIARPAGMETTNTGNPQFQTDPGYQFAFNEGLKAVDARFPGMSKSGAKAQALTQYGQGVADQQYGNWLSRLSSLASVGQTATGQTASLGSNTSGTLASSNPSNTLANLSNASSNAIGNNTTNQVNALNDAAAARASGYVGSANAITSGISGTINNLSSLAGMYTPANSNNPLEYVNVTPNQLTGQYG